MEETPKTENALPDDVNVQEMGIEMALNYQQ